MVDVQFQYYVAHALGTADHIIQAIDQVYKKREHEYFACYKEAEVDIAKALSDLPIKHVQAICKSLGIIRWSEKEGSFDDLYKLLRTGYRFAWDYVKQQQSFNLDDFTQKFMKRLKTSLQSTALITKQCYVGLYLCFVKGFETNYEGKFMDSLATYSSLIWEQIQNGSPTPTTSHPKDYFKSYEQISSYLQLLGKQQTVQDFFRAVLEKEITEHRECVLQIEEGDCSCSNCTGIDEDSLIKISSKRGWAKWASGTKHLFSVLMMDYDELFRQTKVTKALIHNVMNAMWIAKEQFRWKENELPILMMSYLCLHSLQDEYLSARKVLLSGTHEQMLEELENIKKQKENWQAERAQQENAWIQEKKLLEAQVEQLKKESQQHKQDALHYQTQLKQTEINNKEVDSLRRYIQQMQKEDHQQRTSALSLDSKLKMLQRVQAIVIGGHHKWQNRLQEDLPSFKFVYVDDINRNIRYVDSADVVFINTTVMNHGFYDKLMNRMENNTTPLYYLGDYTNKERCINEIFDYMFPNYAEAM